MDAMQYLNFNRKAKVLNNKCKTYRIKAWSPADTDCHEILTAKEEIVPQPFHTRKVRKQNYHQRQATS